MDLYTALAILAVTVASLLTRSGPQLLGAHLRLPATVDAALRYAPACALAGIIVPDLVFVDGAVTWDRANLNSQPVVDFELGQPGEGDRK